MKEIFISRDGVEFSAFHFAEKYLKDRGFSIGSMQRDAPIGIMFGDFCIAKWRNLSGEDRRVLHGQLRGDKRNGPIEVEIFDTAPTEAIKAFRNAPIELTVPSR